MQRKAINKEKKKSLLRMQRKTSVSLMNWTDQLRVVCVRWEYCVVWKEMIDFHEILIVLRIHDVEMYYPRKFNH